MKNTQFRIITLLLFVLLAPLVGAADLVLTWKDNSANEDGFVVQRSPGIGAPAWAEIARVPKDATSYTDTGLPNATAFSYRVAAFNAGGTSAFTNTATGTTVVAPPLAPSDATVVTVTVTVSIASPPTNAPAVVRVDPAPTKPKA